ncbi:hypothetical protein Misp02_47760 [Microtetraspora sp. NBRC 16547]|nr:hypothetical protein Misp02_47760 [Microtetraspora sp. NBRC 16547]
MDAATAAGLLDLLDLLRADGLAVLMATHDPDVARRADRVLHLDSGALRDRTGAPPTAGSGPTHHDDRREASDAR